MALAQVVNMNNPQAVYVAGRLFDELPWLRQHVVTRAEQMALAPAFKDCQFLAGSCGQLLGAIAAAISAVTAGARGWIAGHAQWPCVQCRSAVGELTASHCARQLARGPH